MPKKTKKQKQKQKPKTKKPPILESLYKKVAGPLPESLLIKDPSTDDFLRFLQKF